MRKLKCYFDTSVFNFIYERKDVNKREATLALFSQIQQFEIYISEIVLVEVNETHAPLRSRLLEVIQKYQPISLEIDSETRALAKRYVDEGIIPARYEDDALHIASAVVNDLDVIISWNFQHIVKLKTKLEVNGINMLLGYKEIEICSPEEVIK